MQVFMSLCLFYTQFMSMSSHSLLILYQMAKHWLAAVFLDGGLAGLLPFHSDGAGEILLTVVL